MSGLKPRDPHESKRVVPFSEQFFMLHTKRMKGAEAATCYTTSIVEGGFGAML